MSENDASISRRKVISEIFNFGTKIGAVFLGAKVASVISDTIDSEKQKISNTKQNKNLTSEQMVPYPSFSPIFSDFANLDDRNFVKALFYEEVKKILINEPQTTQAIRRVQEYQPLILEIIKKNKFKFANSNDFLLTALTGIIFVGSKGDANATNNTGDVGLCQINEATAKKIAQSLNLQTYNLRDPKINILFAFKHLENLYEKFPEPSLAVLAYHLGEGNTTKLITEFLANKQNAKTDQTFLKMSERVDRILDTTRLVSEHNITAASVIQSAYATSQHPMHSLLYPFSVAASASAVMAK